MIVRKILTTGLLGCALSIMSGSAGFAANAAQGAFDDIETHRQSGPQANAQQASLETLKQDADALAAEIKALYGKTLGQTADRTLAQIAGVAAQLQDNIAVASPQGDPGEVAFLADELASLRGQFTALLNADSVRDKIFCVADEVNDIAATSGVAPAVVPGIAKWQGGSGTFTLSAQSRIVIEPLKAAALRPLANRLVTDIAEITGLTLPVVESQLTNAGDIGLSLSPCNTAVKTRIGNEGYSLHIGDAVVLRGNVAKGLHVDEATKDYVNSVFYASRTLLQMLMLDGKAANAHSDLPRGYAIDAPLYQERTFMVDVGRGYTDKESLKAYMKFLGWYKFNTFHIHLTDDLLDRTPNANQGTKEGFRLYSNNPAFSNKQPLSADGLYYSKNDWDELEEVAAANGIILVPEIDAPGHATAMVKAIKKIYPSNRSSGNELYVLDPQTVTYIKDIWTEYLPWFKSKIVHIGADESSSAGQTAFINDMARFFKTKGKTLQIWNDAVTSSTILESNVVIQYWTNDPLRSNRNAWINSSIAWYANPNNGAPYASSLGHYGDSFYADDAGLGIDHQNASGIQYWDWFRNTADVTRTVRDLPPIGGQIALWNDLLFHHPYTFEVGAHYHMKDVFPAAGQIWWNGQKKDGNGNLVPYSELRKSVVKLQYGPGVKGVAFLESSPLLSTIPTYPLAARPPYKIKPTYLAQSGLLGGGAENAACKSCDGGNVGWLGTNAGRPAGTVTLTVPVTKAGKYLLPIYYVSGSRTAVDGQITVNDSAPVAVNFTPTGGGANTNASGLTADHKSTMLSFTDQQVLMGVFVDLKVGDNTIKFSDSVNGMPNIGGLGTPLLQPAR